MAILRAAPTPTTTAPTAPAPAPAPTGNWVGTATGNVAAPLPEPAPGTTPSLATRYASTNDAEIKLAAARGIDPQQSAQLTQRLTAAQVAFDAELKRSGSGQRAQDAMMQALGPIDPWMRVALAKERESLAGPLGQPTPDSLRIGSGVQDANGQPVPYGLPSTWGEATKRIFSEVIQDPRYQNNGEAVPLVQLLDPSGTAQATTPGLQARGPTGIGIEGLTGQAANEYLGPLVMAGLGTVAAGPAGGIAGYTAGKKIFGSPGDAAAAATAPTNPGAIPGATGPAGAPGGVGGARVAAGPAPEPVKVSLAQAAADVYAQTPEAKLSAQAADVANTQVQAAQAALAGAVTPEQIATAKANLAQAVQAQQVAAAQLDTSKQAFFRDYQEKNANALSDQAEGKGPSLAYALFQKATDENLANVRSVAAQARGGNVASAGSAAIYAAGNLQAKAAQDAGILRLKEQMDARSQLAQALESGRAGDIQLATTQANLNQQAAISNQGASLSAAVANQSNERETNTFNAAEANKVAVQNAANDLAAKLQAQKEANDNYKFNASEANRIALDNANRDVQTAIANQTNARSTAQFNADAQNKAAITNADRELTAYQGNQANTRSTNEFNAGQTNSVNVSNNQIATTARGQDLTAGTTQRGQDLDYATATRRGNLEAEKYDDQKDAALIKGGTDLAAAYLASQKGGA